jgi:cbb3-type cytochrome oxidase subunit 3
MNLNVGAIVGGCIAAAVIVIVLFIILLLVVCVKLKRTKRQNAAKRYILVNV